MFITRIYTLHHEDHMRCPSSGRRGSSTCTSAFPGLLCVPHTYSWTWTNLIFCNHFQIQATRIFKFLVLTSWFSCSYWKVANIPSQTDNNHSPEHGPLCKPMQASVSVPTFRGLGKALSTSGQVPFPSNSLNESLHLRRDSQWTKCWQSTPRRWKQNPLK